MNEILFKLSLASLLKSVKNEQRKKELRKLCKETVQGILLAYQDDPTFLDEEEA